VTEHQRKRLAFLSEVKHRVGLTETQEAEYAELNEASRRNYLCERCGGLGQQPAGCWNPESKRYDDAAGTCRTCDGVGYLGMHSCGNTKGA